jgi:protoporphyrinogen oxidase
MSALRNALFPGRDKADITTLISQFQYPKLGPGMMWEKAAEQVRAMGIDVVMNAPVTRIEHAGNSAVALWTGDGSRARRLPVTDVVSSMPLSELIEILSPAPPDHVLSAARDLRYRDFLTVALVVPVEFSFPDNWIYIHDPDVAVGRIQNFGSWSPYLVKDGRTCLGLEYFVNEGDALWTSTDAELVALAQRELVALGLVRDGAVETGYVVRQPKAYPVYDEHYQANVDTIRAWLQQELPNVHPVGRNGMHRYNNADHSMLTAMLSVANIAGATPVHDVWTVNVDEDYHEEHRRGSAVDGSSARVIPLPRNGGGRDAPITRRATRAAG